MVSKSSPLWRLIPAFGLALVASIALAGIAAGSAGATTQHWYTCKNVGKGAGVYSEAGCAVKGGSKSYSLEQLTAPAGFNMSPFSGGMKLLWVISGSTFEISCTSQGTEGTVENPFGGGSGLLTEKSNVFLLAGCTLPKEPNCHLENNQIILATTGVAGEFAGLSGPGVMFSPVGVGNTLGEVNFIGSCILSGFRILTGHFAAVAKKTEAGDYFEFGAAGGSLELEGRQAALIGKSKFVTTAGEPLTVAP